MDLRFKHAVEPPATVELHASLRRSVGPLHMFDVAATIEGRSVARGALALAEGKPGPDGAQET